MIVCATRLPEVRDLGYKYVEMLTKLYHKSRELLGQLSENISRDDAGRKHLPIGLLSKFKPDYSPGERFWEEVNQNIKEILEKGEGSDQQAAKKFFGMEAV